VQVQSVQVDLRTYEGVEKLYAAIKAGGRPVDAVAINAGVGVGGDFVRDTSLDAELELIDLNVKSTVHLAKRVLADMVERGSGKVLFTSSIASTMPAPYEAVYAASKSFIQSFAEGLQGEVSDTDVTITSLMPGPTETNFFHRAGMDDTTIGQAKKDDPATVAKQGFEALMEGDKKIVAGGLKTKAQGHAATVLPDSAKAAMHKAQAKPGSGSGGG
jgi:short-subunit dehydrogenase